MNIPQVKRGEVYYANLDPVVGSETGKTRPVVVIQNDIGNQYSPTTIVSILTEFSPKKASYPICVAVGADQGLKKASIVNLAQIRTIDKRRLVFPKIATMADHVMAQVDRALKNSLGLD
jgi:mRNA interferase MazF